MIYNDLPIEHSDFPHAKFPEILAFGPTPISCQAKVH